MLARHVTIVGGYAGVSGQDEVRLRAAGVEVYRLNGASEADTKPCWTSWSPPTPPGPARLRRPQRAVLPEPCAPGGDRRDTRLPDEWTVPDDAVPPPAEPIVEPGDSVRIKVQAPPPTGPADQ